jgi:hypothetical protein
MVIRLYNHHVQSVGMNQILSTSMPEGFMERRYFCQKHDGAIHHVVAQLTGTL